MPSAQEPLQRLPGLIDLTSLNEDDTPDRIEALCRLAAGPFGPPAALCVYPEYVLLARRTLDALGLNTVAVASVANFPDGGADADRVARACRRLRAAGADEVDVVLPYRSLQAGEVGAFRRVADAARAATADGVLKCILETGLLSEAQIDQACSIALDAGAVWTQSHTLFARIDEESLRAKIDALVAPALLQTCERAFQRLGDAVGVTGELKPSTPKTALREANARFAFAVSAYARALSIGLDETDEVALARFQSALAPIDGLRITGRAADALDEDEEDDEPSTPADPVDDPDAPYVPASDDPIDNPFIT